MSTRLHIIVSDQLATRIDEARGDVSRSRWIMRAVESALGDVSAVRPGAVAKSKREDAPVARPSTPTRPSAKKKPTLADTWRR